MTNNIFNGNSNASGLTTGLLGSAYSNVKEVACNLEYIKAVAENIPAVRDAANNMHRNIKTIDATAGPLGTTTYVNLPVGVLDTQVFDFSVVLTDANNAIHSASGGNFTAVIDNGILAVTINADAPAALANSEIRWTLSYEA